MSDSLWPHGLWSARRLCPWDSSGKNTGVGCHFFLQGIFPTWDQTHVSYIGRQMSFFFFFFLTNEPPGRPQIVISKQWKHTPESRSAYIRDPGVSELFTCPIVLHRGCTLQENWTLCDRPWQRWLMNLDSLIGHPEQRLYHIWHVWGSTTRIGSLWELQLRKFEWREHGFSLPESPMLASLQSFLGWVVVLFTFYSWCGFYPKVFVDFIKFYFCFTFLFFGFEAWGILASWSGIEPTPPALEGEIFFNYYC